MNLNSLFSLWKKAKSYELHDMSIIIFVICLEHIEKQKYYSNVVNDNEYKLTIRRYQKYENFLEIKNINTDEYIFIDCFYLDNLYLREYLLNNLRPIEKIDYYYQSKFIYNLDTPHYYNQVLEDKFINYLFLEGLDRQIFFNAMDYLNESSFYHFDIPKRIIKRLVFNNLCKDKSFDYIFNNDMFKHICIEKFKIIEINK